MRPYSHAQSTENFNEKRRFHENRGLKEQDFITLAFMWSHETVYKSRALNHTPILGLHFWTFWTRFSTGAQFWNQCLVLIDFWLSSSWKSVKSTLFSVGKNFESKIFNSAVEIFFLLRKWTMMRRIGLFITYMWGGIAIRKPEVACWNPSIGQLPIFITCCHMLVNTLFYMAKNSVFLMKLRVFW